jgi:serine/threonine protein kinase
MLKTPNNFYFVY